MTKKSILEEALLEAQALEDAVKSNAKEILASTMKEEIEELVKESLSEQEEIEDYIEDTEEEDVDFAPAPEDTEQDFDDEDVDQEPLDLRGASDEEVLKVFKLMGGEDGIIVTQDDDVVDIKDEETGAEYKVELGESLENTLSKSLKETDDMDEMDMDEYDGDMVDEDEDPLYEIELGDMDEMDMEEGHDKDWGSNKHEYDRETSNGVKHRTGDVGGGKYGKGGHYKTYETDMEEDADWGSNKHEYDRETSGGMKHRTGDVGGGKYGKGGHYKTYETETNEDADFGENSREYKRKSSGGVKHKAGNVGGGKYGKGGHYKDYENNEVEANEASRTLGFGSKKGRGLRKGFTNNRNLTFKEGVKPTSKLTESKKRYQKLLEHAKTQDSLIEKLMGENKSVKAKSKQFKSALNDFRTKIQEVAVFNTNLAYATKLFTEHTTSKEEKINIMRRFDEVETLNESKNLFKQLNSEFSRKTKNITESVKKKITKAPSKGSTNLIESKIYESPQISRIKDMMRKI